MTESQLGTEHGRPSSPEGVKRSARTSIAVGFGTAIEWYDYLLYAYTAGIIIAPLFFPSSTGAVGLLASFATFAVGFVARPIGGMVLGALSDRWGRRPVLMFSIVLIGAATTAIGLLPPYSAIGVWAPVLLVLLRIIQGFGAGAELAGAITLANESAGRRRKGFRSAMAMAGGGVGGLVALTIVTSMSTALSEDDFMDWGWRVPFLFSAVLTIVGILLRRSLEESPEFKAVEQARRDGVAREARINPLIAFGQAVKANPRNWIAAFLIPTGLNVTGYGVTAFGISYLVGSVGMSTNDGLVVNLVVSAIMVVGILLFGWLCDKIGAQRVMIVSVIGGVVLAVPYYWLLDTGDLLTATLASCLMIALGWAAAGAAHSILMPVYFPAEIRSTGLFSARELQGALVAGPAPFIATALMAAMGGTPWGAAGMLVAAHLITLVGLLIARPQVGRAEYEQTPAFAGIRLAEAPATTPDAPRKDS